MWSTLVMNEKTEVAVLRRSRADMERPVNRMAALTQAKSLVCFSLYQSFPAYNGGSNRIFNLAKAYSTQFNVSVYGQSLHRLGRSQLIEISSNLRELQNIDVSSFIGTLGCRALRLPQLLENTALSLSAPRWLVAHVKSADVIVIEQPWQARWVQKSMSSRCVLVYDAHNVELDMFHEASLRGPKRFRKKMRRIVERRELDAVNHSDLVMVTSDIDRKRMVSLYGCPENKICVAPNGIDYSGVPQVKPSERERAKRALGLEGKTTVIFLGAKHPPNKGAVDRILEISRLPVCSEIHFLIVGAVSAYFDNPAIPNVTFTGFVEDTAPYFAAADIAINPVETGGGSSLKQVECMARGLPTVVTPFGARGFNVIDGVNAVVRESQLLVDGIFFLMSNPSRAEKIADEARRTALDYDWATVGSRLTTRFVSLSGGSRP
jgi:glycosyltransferase involved in cell wall biosynthesis